MLWDYITILFVISLVLCAVGLYKSEYLHTLGYGFAVSGMGVALLVLNVMHAFDATWPNYVMFALLILFGIRNSIFAMIREVEKDKTVLYWKIIVWLFVSVLYVALVAPTLFTVEGEYGYYPGACMWLGMLVCVAGLVVSVVADLLKSKQKDSVKKVTIKECYRLFLNPVYLGEILFWLGILVTSLDSLKGFAEWAISIAGFVGIVVVRGLPQLEKAK